MDEHDDDLESTVHEDAEEETDTFPVTQDELEESEESEEEPGTPAATDEPGLSDDDAEI